LIRQAVGDAVTVEHDLASEPLRANVDPNQLETALLNLAVNARDAMSKAGRLTLSTGLVAASGGGSPEVRIAMRDTGHGMSAEAALRIFEPFYTTKEVGKGSGLGLSQVHGFVSQSGGRVTVASEPGQGATFEIFLPLTKAAANPRATPPDGPLPTGDGEHILVVEDDPEVRALCVDVLVELGYRCVTAASGQEALDRLATDETYALLFSDVVMPGGLNGVDLAHRALATRPDLKILLTSGYIGEDAIRQLHGFPILDKPYQRKTLAVRLREALAGQEPSVLTHANECA
jgi:CheY-like chemotaxis protein